MKNRKMRRDSFVYVLVQEISIEEKRGYNSNGAKTKLNGVRLTCIIYIYIYTKLFYIETLFLSFPKFGRFSLLDLRCLGNFPLP